MIRKRQDKMAKKYKKSLYGDTIVEAVVAIAIYSIVAVLALGSMSSGLSTAQRNLESTMSRSMIDSQSDALRYFYESYLATKSGVEDDSYYADIWKRISPRVERENDPTSLDDPSLSEYSCAALMSADKQKVENDNPKISVTDEQLTIFALSGRGAISSAKANVNKDLYGFGKPHNNTGYIQKLVITDDRIVPAPLYPRITYKNMRSGGMDVDIINSDTATGFLNGMGGKDEDGNEMYQSRVAYNAEGVWVFPKKTNMGYDFYVRTCWNAVGSRAPSTFTSVVRLYNAE